MSVAASKLPERLLAFVAVVLMGAAGTSIPAFGFGRDGHDVLQQYSAPSACGADGTVYYAFKDTAVQNWHAPEQAAATSGIENWENVKDRDGSKVINLVEVVPSSNQRPLVTLKWADLGGSVNGSADDCSHTTSGTGGVEIDFQRNNGDTDRIGSTVAHEFGHILGLGHVTKDENTPESEETPTLTPQGGCLNDRSQAEYSRITPSRDDHAALIQRQGDGGQTPMVPDPSFEGSHWDDWWHINDGSLERFALEQGADPPGSYAIRIEGESPLSQHPAPVLYSQSEVGDAAAIGAAIWLRKSDPDAAGSVVIGIKRRTYPVVDCGLGSTSGDFVLVEQRVCTPTSSWDTCATDSATITLAHVLLRVTVENHQSRYVGGAIGYERVPVKLDSVRTESR